MIMQKIISNHELDSMLIKVLQTKNFMWNECSYYFQDLYLTGCRSRELLSSDKWKRVDKHYVLRTAKTEKLRLFEPLQLSAHFRNSIEYNDLLYGGLTYDQLTREFRRVVPMHPIWSGNRIADTYLFRYNRARQLFATSGDLLEVMEFFGWQSAEVAGKYITTPLMFDPYRSTMP